MHPFEQRSSLKRRFRDGHVDLRPEETKLTVLLPTDPSSAFLTSLVAISSLEAHSGIDFGAIPPNEYADDFGIVA